MTATGGDGGRDFEVEFERVVREGEIDGDALERAVRGPEHDRRRDATPGADQDKATDRPTDRWGVPTIPEGSAPPERPVLVEPSPPEAPALARAEQTGRWATVGGYVLSVLVGAFGQVAFFGSWLAGLLPSPGNWLAAALGAAFSEVCMVGAGNSSLVKRRDGGTWRLLLAVACLVCAGAVSMQVAHWSPKGVGVALVFALASSVGFVVHMVVEHSRLADHEQRRAAYESELAAYRAELHRRYEADRAAWEIRHAPPRPVAAPLPQPPAASERKPRGSGPPAKGAGRATKDVAVRLGVEQGLATPARLRDGLLAAGYARPSSSSLENWCRVIKTELGQQ